jgi:hypothetical protein
MAMSDDAWFRPKRPGYGAGLPVRWQGWAATGLYVVAVLALTPLALTAPLVYGIAVAGLSAAFVLVAARKTEGGWRWRGAGDD